MISKKIIIPLFLLVAAAQLYAPASMIWEREKVIAEGEVYFFETAPIDPSDPFRGKYVRLNFKDETIPIDSIDDWVRYQEVYLLLEKDSAGFARYSQVSVEPPANSTAFLKVEVNYISPGSGELHFNLPFNRFYMEESKARPAEELYQESIRHGQDLTYAVASVREGEAVLLDVLVNGEPLRNLVEAK